MIEFRVKTLFSSFLNLAYAYSHSYKMQLLLSGDQPENKPSYLCLFPSDEMIIDYKEHNPWEVLKKKLYFSSASKIIEWVGYLSYEMSAFSDPDKKLPYFKSEIPLAHFLKPSVVCTYQRGLLNVKVFQSDQDPLSIKMEKQKFSSQKKLLSLISSLPDIPQTPLSFSQIKESDTLESYLNKIKTAKELILNGDIYQVNLSRSVYLKTNANPFDLFYKLFQINPTPFSAFLNLGDYQIISASPERFLMKFNDILETKPIKGTCQRGESPYEDILLRNKLLHSTKEEAELMMITDLMRNDLGAISELGTVNCIERKKMLELTNVFHLESTITSKPLKGHPLDMIQACYPAGSISGCPKLRAQEIIQSVEKRARHIYCGSIGYFLGNGDFDFNVAIRTALLKDQRLEVQIGGAITYDSNSEAEYKETTYKGGPFFKIFNIDQKANQQ